MTHGSKIDKTTTVPQQWAFVGVLLDELGISRDSIHYYGNGNACLRRPDGTVVHVSRSGWVLDSKKVKKYSRKPSGVFLGYTETV